MRLTTNSEVRWVIFICLLLLLQAIVKTSKYFFTFLTILSYAYFCSVKEFSLAHFKVCFFYSFQLLLRALFPQKKSKTLFSFIFRFKIIFLLLLGLSNVSAIGRIVAIFVSRDTTFEGSFLDLQTPKLLNCNGFFIFYE
jgi:hypothetical protein